MPRAVVALGGNAILPKGADETKQAELDAIRTTVNHLSPLLDDYDTVLTHGNGPQVGTLLLQQQFAETDMPLDVLVAETQAQIGYLLQQALQNAGAAASTVVTQVAVDPDDPGFDEPTKPVGPYYTEDAADEQPFPTKKVDDSDTPYRRVVPSPAPQRIVELDTIEQLLDAGAVPVCVGGGIPMVNEDEQWRGIEAVIDKDRASALLAQELDADLLVILTNVEYAYTDYGTADEAPLEDVTVDELEQLLNDGMFGPGSMRPKVEACINFIRNGGQDAIITTPQQVDAALNGETGTWVTANG
jgi:carbamate kinase